MVLGGELLQLAGEDLADGIHLRLRETDGRDDALVDIGDQPRGTCEQVQNAVDVDEVPDIRDRRITRSSAYMDVRHLILSGSGENTPRQSASAISVFNTSMTMTNSRGDSWSP
jgi:hypothetical protein